MICRPCLAGGQNLTKARLEKDDVAYDNVLFLHSKCIGGTWCDCHHDTDIAAVDWARVERERNAE